MPIPLVQSLALLFPSQEDFLIWQVTILVAAEGEHKLPTIKTLADLKEALQKLGSIPADSIQAVEVLWTPQDENDTLSECELLHKYPLLRSL
jgi:uncharacterized membrane protein